MSTNLSGDIRFAVGLIHAQAKDSAHPVHADTTGIFFDLNDLIGSTASTGDATIVGVDKVVSAVEGAVTNGAVIIGRHSKPPGTNVLANAESVVRQHNHELLAMAGQRAWDWSKIDGYIRQLGPAVGSTARSRAAGDLRVLELTMELLAVAIGSDDPSFRSHRTRLVGVFDEIAANTVAYRWCTG